MVGPIKLKIQTDTFQMGTFKPPFVLPTDYEERLVSLRQMLSDCETISESIKTTKFDSRKPTPIPEVLKLSNGGDNFALSHLARFLFYETQVDEEKWLSKVIIHTLAYGQPGTLSVLEAYKYGKMLLSENNVSEALECFKQLEDGDFSPALATVGRIYYSNPLVQKDEKLAKEKWKRAENLGHFIASLWLARLKIRQQSIFMRPFGCLNYAIVFVVGVLKGTTASDEDAYIRLLI